MTTENNELVVLKEVDVIDNPDSVVALVKEGERPLARAMNNMVDLDWRRLAPNQMAFLLTTKPFPASGGGTTYLTFRQALLFALRAFELGLSPLGPEIFFNPTNASVNVTLEGKRTLARNRGIDLGPPQFVDVSREWNELPRMTKAGEEAKKAGFTKDIGVTCKMRVGPAGLNEYASYTAYLSGWYVGRSMVWQEKPEWMLAVRAQDKCITMALGTGVSEMIHDD